MAEYEELELNENNLNHVTVSIEGDTGPGVGQNESKGNRREHFIRDNFVMTKPDYPIEKGTRITKLLEIDKHDDRFKNCDIYGLIDSDLVDANCFIRSKYLRFSPCKEIFKNIQNLLCDNWKMDTPNFMVNVFGKAAKAGSRQCQMLEEFVNMGRESKAMFFVTEKSEQLFTWRFTSAAAKNSHSSARQVVQLRNWFGIKQEERDKFKASSVEDKEVPVFKPIGSGKKVSLQFKDLQNAAVNLFMDLAVAESDTADSLDELEDLLLFIREFSKVFDDDMPGKRTFQVKDDEGVIRTASWKGERQRFKLHMCYPVNVFLPDTRKLEKTGHLSPEDVAMLKCLVKSHIPLIILDDSGKCYQDIVKRGEGVEDNEDNENNENNENNEDNENNKDNEDNENNEDNEDNENKEDNEDIYKTWEKYENQVVFWIDEHEEESEMIISDIKLGLRDLLVRTRKYPDTDDHDLFRRDEYTWVHLSILLNLTEIEEFDKYIQNLPCGVMTTINAILHFYKRYDLIELVLKKPTMGPREVLFDLAVTTNVINSLIYRKQATEITQRGLVLDEKHEVIKKVEKDEDDPDQLEVDPDQLERYKIFYKLINKHIGKGTHLNQLHDPHCLPVTNAAFIYFILNQELELADTFLKHMDYPILHCFVGIKALQRLKSLRTDKSSLAFVDVNKIDTMMSQWSTRAVDILKSASKQGLDISPVLFQRHPQYDYKTILDLAEETKHYDILAEKTNAHAYITKRWNAAMSPSTPWYKIILTWLSLGLAAPWLIQYDCKISERDEEVLFLNNTGRKRRWMEKVKCFWTSPRSKFYLLMLTYIGFLYAMTMLVLDTTRPRAEPKAGEDTDDQSNLSILGYVCIVFVVCFISVEIEFNEVTRYNVFSKFKVYIKSGYNQIDLLSAFSFIVHFILNRLFAGSFNEYIEPEVNRYHGNETIYLIAKVVLSFSYLGYIIRFTQFLQLSENIGPKLISIKNMLADLVFFAAFLLLTIFAYGMISEFLIHPYPRIVAPNQILEIMKRPYVNMFGELDLDTFEEQIEVGVCKYEQYLKDPDVSFDTLEKVQVCGADSEFKCGKMCENFKLAGRILLGLYTIVTVILLTNLLISIFGKTYEDDFDKTKETWQLQRYKMVVESESQFTLPFPPFNFLHSLYGWITCLVRFFRESGKVKRKEPPGVDAAKINTRFFSDGESNHQGESFYRIHLRELEYRCREAFDKSNVDNDKSDEDDTK